MIRSIRRLAVYFFYLAGVLALAVFLPETTLASNRQFYYINSQSVTLHSLPLLSSPVAATAKLNDRVEKLGDSPKGWTKVRNLRDGSTGWLPTRNLSAKIVAAPLPGAASPRKRPKRPPAASKPTPQPKEEAPAEERPKPM